MKNEYFVPYSDWSKTFQRPSSLICEDSHSKWTSGSVASFSHRHHFTICVLVLGLAFQPPSRDTQKGTQTVTGRYYQMSAKASLDLHGLIWILKLMSPIILFLWMFLTPEWFVNALSMSFRVFLSAWCDWGSFQPFFRRQRVGEVILAKGWEWDGRWWDRRQKLRKRRKKDNGHQIVDNAIQVN